MKITIWISGIDKAMDPMNKSGMVRNWGMGGVEKWS